MKQRIYVPVTPRTLAALVRLADRERRRIHIQAAILLERSLGIEPEEEAGSPVERPAEEELG